MKIRAIKTRIFCEGEDLFSFIKQHVPKLKEKSILVITSKIVALAEGRTALWKGQKDLERLIKKESQLAIHVPHVWLTMKGGTLMASAGIDRSNANGKLILFPLNSFKTAQLLRQKIRRHYRLKDLGIIITDSRLVPLRAGVVGMAVGYAGVRGIRDYRGKPDIFNRKLKYSRTDVADSLATGAVLLMGEGGEQQPLAVIENAPVVFQNRINRRELNISIKEDFFGPLFVRLLQRKRR